MPIELLPKLARPAGHPPDERERFQVRTRMIVEYSVGSMEVEIGLVLVSVPK